MPSGGDDSSKGATSSLRRVHVEILRIELSSKIDNIPLADGNGAKLVHSPDFIVFKEPLIRWYSKPMERHQALRLAPKTALGGASSLALFAGWKNKVHDRIFKWDLLAGTLLRQGLGLGRVPRELNFFKWVGI